MAILSEQDEEPAERAGFRLPVAPLRDLERRFKTALEHPHSAREVQLDRQDLAALHGVLTCFLANMPTGAPRDDGVYTTGEAAGVLNVSRPFLVKLLENGEIPFYRVGRHRRVRQSDLHAYKAMRNRDSHRLLDELAAEAQELELGYG